MLIGEAAARAGVSRDTIRFYTRLGLVSCTLRQAGSREYADYDDDAVELVGNLKIAKSIGFTLSELAPIVREYESGDLRPDRQREILESKLEEVERKRAFLNQILATIHAKLADLDEAAPTSPS